ncbi:Cell division cycle protein 123 [Yarrowia sp. B02]|nr:Cell division cycle protein 123 [Yarrowia sp. B02]
MIITDKTDQETKVDDTTTLTLTREHLLNCQFSSWYKLYKTITPKTRIIKPLPQDFINYLSEDGVILPDEEQANYGSDGGVFEEYSDDEDELDSYVSKLTDFHPKVQAVIDEFGAVAPKLNWSSPQDAIWISPSNSTRCVTVNDVYLLLKSSDYIAHDLTLLDSLGGIPKDFSFELVLRKWININPALEFRCFVKDRELIAVTQRDQNYYEFLAKLKEKFLGEIELFFYEHIKDTFPDSSFVFDVYIPEPYDKVWLIDFNVFYPTTDSLIEWSTLVNLDATCPSFDLDLLLVDKELRNASFACQRHSQNKVPMDIVNASMDTEAMVEMLRSQQREMDRLDGSNREDDAEDAEDADDAEEAETAATSTNTDN